MRILLDWKKSTVIFWNTVTGEMQIFLAITTAEYGRYDREKGFVRIFKLLRVHDKKIARRIVYVICGALIALTLAGFILIQLALPDLLAGSKATFAVETICLVLFGFSWMTASQLRYYRKIKLFLKLRNTKTELAPQLGNI